MAHDIKIPIVEEATEENVSQDDIVNIYTVVPSNPTVQDVNLR